MMPASGIAQGETLLDAFAAMVEQFGDRTAVKCDQRKLSYRELDAEANALAAAIQEQNAVSGRPVGIFLGRSADVIIAILAVLKTGSYYVPLDPAIPSARVAAMLSAADISVVITSEVLADALPGDIPVLFLQDRQYGPPLPPYRPVTVASSDLAYVMFTSGTTGRPKGVQISHGNVLWLFRAADSLFEFSCTDVWSLFHSFAFDFSVWEMWGALLHGACVVVVPDEVCRDTAAFRELVRKDAVTVLSQTPTALQAFIAEDAGDVERLTMKWIVIGGEALSFPDLRRWVSKYGDSAPQLINMYGVTETTVHASYRRVLHTDLDEKHNLIGNPLPGEGFVLIGEDLAVVPDGEVGEIVVVGPGVAAGYLGQPELSSRRFVDLAGPHARPGRGYRTGDLARLTAGGEYEYLGRNDDQVKIRGFRIELGEIRAALATAAGVSQAAVIAHHAKRVENPVVKQRSASKPEIARMRDLVRGGGVSSQGPDTKPRLVAYIVAGENFSTDQLFQHLRDTLPSYMIPTFVVQVNNLPVNQNGKVDLTRLPEPTPANCLRESSDAFGAGSDPDVPGMQAICELFEEVLGITGITADDSFFRVGGDSILALKLRAAAAGRGIILDLADIYSLHTPRALAAVEGESDSEGTDRAGPFSLISPADREILPDGIEDAYPVGTLQAGLLFHSAYDADVNLYHDIFMFRLKAPYDHEAMEWAIDAAVRRHDIIRSSFNFSDYSVPLQLVHSSAKAPFVVTDVRHLTPDEQEAELGSWREREMRASYDWSRPPLMRFSVHILGEGEFMFSMSFHDAVLDGWSESSLITEILTDYWACMNGGAAERARPALRYADFIAAEQVALRSEDIRRFWLEELAEVQPTMSAELLAGDLLDHDMGFLSVDIEASLSDSLDTLARAKNVSVKHVLLVVHACVLATLTGRDDVVLGVESNGRLEEEGGTDVLGLHLNVVPFRMQIRGKSWSELIDAAWAKENELLAVRRFPYAEVLRVIGMQELTDISFNYTHFHSYEQVATATAIEVVDAKGYNATNITLRAEFNTDPFTKLLTLDLEANLSRVHEDELHRIADLYRNALENVAADSECVPARRNLLGEQRWQELLASFRGPAKPAEEPSFFALFDKAVAGHGEKIAATSREETITYRDLAMRVTSVAGWLRREGVRTGTIVGLGATRDLGYLTVLLAILRIGAVYLPLPSGPPVRLASMLRRSNPGLILCDDSFRTVIADATRPGARLADVDRVIAESSGCEPYRGPGPLGKDIAYLLFTSGSTGEPKGALIRHYGMLNHVLAKIEALQLLPGDLVAQDAVATFDISIWQWLAPLAVGACTVIYPDEVGQDPPRLLRAVAEDGITVLEVVPSVLNVINAELGRHGIQAFPGLALRWVVSQAEVLTPQCANTFRRLLPEVGFLNMWGATETSDDCSNYEVVGPIDPRRNSVPIGTPIRNTVLYVLDGNRSPVLSGTPGELYVSGPCVGAGYINDTARTTEAFVSNPFSTAGTELMYRTGDRVRQLADGVLEFLGRVDNQVKIRGQRVELDEVIHALSGVEGLQDSMVVARDRGDGSGTQLVGFFVPMAVEGGGEPGAPALPPVAAADIRSALGRILPRYAIPDFLIRLEALPRTRHGKIDTKALAGWNLGDAAPEIPEVAGTATETESVIAEIWRTVLGVDRLLPTANFFELGGHSLHATQAAARLSEHFSIEMPVRMIFESPSARELGVQIDRQLASTQRTRGYLIEIPNLSAETNEFPLATSQLSLYFLNQLLPGDRSYEYGNLLYLCGPLDVEALRYAVDTLTLRHDILSMRFGERDGVPFQTAAPEHRIQLEIEEVNSLPPGASPEEMLDLVRVRRETLVFDLEHGPVLRARLYRFSVAEHVLEWSTHHMVSDGWSIEIVVKELQEAYIAYREGRQPNLPQLPIQYGDYAFWQQEFLRSAGAASELDFWRDYLKGYPGELALSTDFDHDQKRSRTSSFATRAWDLGTMERIKLFTQERQTTPFVLFHAIAAVLMAKIGHGSDVVLGAAVAGRTIPDTEHLVGFFANTLPFRYQVDVSRTADEALRSATASALTVLAHQLVPFGEIVKAVGGPRGHGTSPLVQVFVTVDQYPVDLSALPELSARLERVPSETSPFHLVFDFAEEHQLKLTVQYDSSLFAASTIDRIVEALNRLMLFFLTRPASRLQEASLISEQDRQALKDIWAGLSDSACDLDGAGSQVMTSSHYWAEFVRRVRDRGLFPALLLAM